LKKRQHINIYFSVNDQRRWRSRCIGIFRNSWSLIIWRANGKLVIGKAD